MEKPGGTGSPRLHISARLAPFPPLKQGQRRLVFAPTKFLDQEYLGLGDGLAKLAGLVLPATPLEAVISGEPFGTYFVEWRHGKAKGSASLALAVVEDEQPADDGKKNSVQRLSLSARAGESDSTDYAILRLGDRPQSVRLTAPAARAPRPRPPSPSARSHSRRRTSSGGRPCIAAPPAMPHTLIRPSSSTCRST